jgi:diguanylate cyclase (GGDEF)-like protein
MANQLDTALSEARDVPEASQVLVDHLVACGLTRPSVYLARGNRLRIQAVAGYQQIFDGMPFGAGVIGRAYVTGEPIEIEDVCAEDGYLRANPETLCELAVPMRRRGQVVAVLDVESPEPLDDERRAIVFDAADSFEQALDRLGTLALESPAQRLVRHSTRLTTLTDEQIIQAEAVLAACDVADMQSAALLLPGPRGRFHAVEASGMLSDVLTRAPQASIEAIARLVQSGCSLYTVGGAVDTAEELGALTAEGAQAVIAVPLTAGVDGRGVLLLADPRPLVPDTEIVELLETLATHAASCLRTAAAVEELRARAATDPLTGLGHHATFHEALDRARTRREAIAVLMADIDGFKAINDTRGHQAGDRILRETAAALSGALRRGDELFRIGGDEFAALIRVGDEHEAIEAGRRLREAVAALGEVTVSIGVALPQRDETDASLLARADKALYSVKADGRDGVALLS